MFTGVRDDMAPASSNGTRQTASTLLCWPQNTCPKALTPAALTLPALPFLRQLIEYRTYLAQSGCKGRGIPCYGPTPAGRPPACRLRSPSRKPSPPHRPARHLSQPFHQPLLLRSSPRKVAADRGSVAFGSCDLPIRDNHSVSG